jgi:hypothetical protein
MKIKAILEILNNNLKTICFTINKEGMFLRTRTNANQYLEMNLLADKFDVFTFNFPAPIHIGVESHFCSFSKALVNKSSAIFSITTPNILKAAVMYGDSYSFSMEVITEVIQNVSCEPLQTYSQPGIPIKIPLFTQTCKLFKGPSQDFVVVKEKGLLKMIIKNMDLITKTAIFGSENKNDNSLITQQYNLDQFIRIIKVTDFAKDSIKVHLEEGNPMMIQAECDLGVFCVYFLKDGNEEDEEKNFKAQTYMKG